MTLDTSVSTSGIGRLFRGQTAIDFYGKRTDRALHGQSS